MEWLWELQQQNQISQAENKASDAKYASQEAAMKLHALERAMDRLLLVNRAMWEIMQERLGITMNELSQKIQEIDLRDGTKDGRCTRKAQLHCDACGRTQSSRHAACLYCGAKLHGGDVFDTVK